MVAGFIPEFDTDVIDDLRIRRSFFGKAILQVRYVRARRHLFPPHTEMCGVGPWRDVDGDDPEETHRATLFMRKGHS